MPYMDFSNILSFEFPSSFMVGESSSKDNVGRNPSEGHNSWMKRFSFVKIFLCPFILLESTWREYETKRHNRHLVTIRWHVWGWNLLTVVDSWQNLPWGSHTSVLQVLRIIAENTTAPLLGNFPWPKGTTPPIVNSPRGKVMAMMDWCDLMEAPLLYQHWGDSKGYLSSRALVGLTESSVEPVRCSASPFAQTWLPHVFIAVSPKTSPQWTLCRQCLVSGSVFHSTQSKTRRKCNRA